MLANQRAMMGVSLANRLFSKVLFRRLGEWAREASLRSIDVVLFEECEAVNYVVVRGLPAEAAGVRAIRRATELKRAIEKVVGTTAVPIGIVRESELRARLGDGFARCYSRLQAAFEGDTEFREDVIRQVTKNVASRVESSGTERRNVILLGAAAYILRELAVFHGYFSERLGDIELYPGQSLFVKKELWLGKYGALRDFALPVLPGFVDVSFLTANAAR